MRGLGSGLALRTALPFVGAAVLMGALLTLTMLHGLSDLADERLRTEMTTHAREVLSILGSRHDELVRSGRALDERERRVSLGLALDDLKRHAANGALAVVVRGADGGLLLSAGPEALARALAESDPRNPARPLELPGGARRTALEFQPWGLGLVLAHTAEDFQGLMRRVRGAALAGILAFTLLATASLLAVHTGLSRPVRRIVDAMRAGRIPEYRGIAEFEELTRGVAEMMRDLEARQRELAEMAAFAMHNPGPVLHLAADGLIRRHNPAAAALLGMNLIGRPVAEVLPALGPETLAGCGNAQPLQVEQDLGERAFLLTARRATEGGGYFVYAADITARREAERLRDDVEHMARHNLKEPAVSMLSGVLLLRRGALDADQARVVDEIERLAYRTIEMVGRTLALSRMERGAYRLSPQAVDALDVVRRLAHSLAGPFPDVPIEILLHGRPAGPSDTFHILGEETLAHSVLFNFLQNAVEAAGGRPVRVELTRAANGMSRIAVANALPVPESMRGRFFEKYASAGKSHGTGLGAYAARLMARAMGGDATMRASDADGTRVEITLPSA